MAVTDAYADAETYRDLANKTDDSEDPEILEDLTAVSRWLEKKLGRFFTKDAAAVARVYYPEAYGRSLIVNDLAAAPTSIKVDEDLDGLFTDETAFAATDYELRPLNADKGPEPRPYTEIWLPEWTTQNLWRPKYKVEVTAQFGWPSVPKPIEFGVCRITAILRLETPWATSRIPESIDQSVDAAPSARRILDQLLTSGYQRLVFA